MQKKYALTYLLLFITCSMVFAQPKPSHVIDSLTKVVAIAKSDTNKVKALNLLSEKVYKAGDKDKSLQYGIDALDLANKLYYKPGQANALMRIAVANYAKLKYADALRNYQLGLNIEAQLKDTFQMAIFYTRIGLVYFRQANLPEALQADFTGLKLRQEIHDSTGMSTSFINLGNVYSEQNNYVEALKNEKQALKIALRFRQQNNTSACYNNLGGINVKLKQYDTAIAYFKLAQQLEEKIGDQEGVAIVLDNLAEICIDEAKFAEAMDYTLKARALMKQIGYKRGIEPVYIHMAQICNATKQYAKGKLYADTVVTLSGQTGSKDYIEAGYECLSRADSGLGDFKAALTNYKLSVTWHDSLTSDENTKKTVQAEMNYAFDRKQDAEKAEQDKKDIIQKEQSRKQQITIYFISGFLLLVVFFALFITRSLQQNRRKTIIISKQKEEVEQQKSMVEKQNVLIEHQKAIVEEKNKDITDSIKYASRIQRALLTTDEYIGKQLKEYFILFKPRDIVSGDFYWAYASPPQVGEGWGEAFYIACCDCTGHGVPGAFMSLLNITMLNEAIIERKIIRPDFVLNDIRTSIIKALNPDGADSGKDGMDCALAMIDFKNNVLQTSCANNPVWIVRGNELIEIHPDKMPVGIQHGEQKSFTVHTINLRKGDVIYMFTDGYADQFGGPKGKKFKYKALQEILIANSQRHMSEQKAILELTFEEWKGDLEQVDDVLVIGVRV